MVLPLPPSDPNSPIPNGPFTAPENEYVKGPYYPTQIGEGLEMDEGVLTVPLGEGLGVEDGKLTIPIGSGLEYVDGVLTATGGSTTDVVKILSGNKTYYISPTGNDITGDGSAAAPWYSPHKVMSFLRDYVITGKVTVSVEKGEYTFTTACDLSHAQGNNITIGSGALPVGTPPRPTYTTLTGGGDRGNTTATAAYNYDILYNWYSQYAYIFKFPVSHGFTCSWGSPVTLQGMLIVGQGNTSTIFCGIVVRPTLYGSAVSGIVPATSGVIIGDMAIHGFPYDGIQMTGGGKVSAINRVTITNCKNFGVSCNLSSLFTSYNGVQVLNCGNGFSVDMNSTLYLLYCVSQNNLLTGFKANLKSLIIMSDCISTNLNQGINLDNASMAYVRKTTFTGHGGPTSSGFVLSNTSTLNFAANSSSTVVLSDMNLGISASNGSFVYASGSMQNITGNSLVASYGASINYGGGTIGKVNGTGWGAIRLSSTTNVTGTVSPPLNTVGNGNFYIYQS
jgi:uncharacterized protein YaiE (UPF0345 family)